MTLVKEHIDTKLLLQNALKAIMWFYKHFGKNLFQELHP